MRRMAAIALAGGLLVAAPASALARLPSVRSGHRPGPKVLYEKPPRAPQLENASPWTAKPILVSGASAYRRGEFLYQDFIYDDHGAAGVRDPGDPFNPAVFLFSPKKGTVTYPTDPVFANNAADLVELRVKPVAGAIAFRVTVNTLKDASRTAFTIALGSSAVPRSWPHGAGVSSPAALFLTVHGGTAELRDAATNAVKTPAPTATVDRTRRQFDVRVPHAAWNPGNGVVRMAAGVGLWDPGAGSYLAPQPGSASTARPGGGAASGAALFNLAFRLDEPMPKISSPGAANTIVEGGVGVALDGTWWRERGQAEALRSGDVSHFAASVDFGKLAARRDDDSQVPKSGPMDRIFASHTSLGQGVDYSTTCFPSPPEGGCPGTLRGQLQPYSLYVPRKPVPARGWGITLLMHGLSANHNEFLASRNASEFGERGPGSVVAAPNGRGPDGFYTGIAEADVFEMWADVARHYRVDSNWAAPSGYSMGGIGTFRLSVRWPDLFGRAFPIVGYPDDSRDQLPSLRNLPIMFWNAGQDELVGLELSEPGRMAVQNAGVRYDQWLFNPAGHITLGNNDEFGPAADFLGRHRANPSPPHVTFVVDPGEDSASAHVVADHAYWLSGLRVRDRDAAPTGTIDARSRGFGVGDPPVKSLATRAGTLTGGSHGPLPYGSRRQDWGRAPRTRKANRLDVRASNVATATVDVRRAHVTCNVDVRITSDGPLRIRLARCGRIVSTGCLSRRSSIGPRNIGRIRLNRTRRRLLRLRVQPRRRTRRSFRYCVKRSRGRVVAVFSSRGRRGRARLVTSTARYHRMRRVGRGASVRRLARAFPHRVRIARGLYRARARSRRLFGTRRGRVRFVAVADRRLIARPKTLRRYLRRAGL
jgi:predicted esterase